MLRKIPFLLAITAMAGGVLIAIFFGANEKLFEQRIAAGLERNAEIQAMADPVAKAAKIKTEASKNWRYYQRFHFHAASIGAMTMGLLLFLSRVEAPDKLKLSAAYLTAVGGFLYPLVWLFAGIYGPEMGRHQAKEAFAIFGYSGGLFLVGALLTLGLAARYKLRDV